ncbi:CSC1-like protein 2 isoform X2 [Lingula anatina]|uniref:CSC1-like protein 2 isoform X2 n=1 Tax=Lingula anatina TaxID=7574 RepID=A0A1S3JLU6_LINAN|nr:CSC1-like protein 2 isoform X2 [Lingula anatina]|eukprot:XP_013411385.1 CSC1-like protein 2 isoform X2 [Lingula anatina]
MSVPQLHSTDVVAANLTCDRYYSWDEFHNKTKLITIYGGYEGIPENLLINFIVWLLLLILFAILRKKAWDYGRIALVSRRAERWTSLFYGDHDEKSVNAALGSVESLDKHIDHHDTGFCSWLPAFFKIKDSHILHKCGPDAVQYLSFQRYLLVYLALICVLSVAVILPVNFQGDQEQDQQQFGHTTISNLKLDSTTLWVHAVFSVVFIGLAVYFMRHFSSSLSFEEDDEATRTLMISHIPLDKCFKNTLQQHFQEAYPEFTVQDIQFAYNISDLINKDNSRKKAHEARVFSENELKTTGQRPTMVPYKCGRVCCCCHSCGCEEVDAIEFYSRRERELTNQVEVEKATSFQKALGIAFVTFENEYMAQRVCVDFRTSCKGSHNPHPSSLGRDLALEDWNVSYAPGPDNIYWENLSLDPWVWWIKCIVINGVLIILLFFLSTPSILMAALDNINFKKALEDLHSPILVQFLPTLILWSFSALLPWLVYYSDQFVGHWTRTAEHHTVMRKIFIFLILMVLVLPSLGLTSIKAFFEYTVSNQTKEIRWECIFLPDNGAFFVNYVITSALIGTGLELMRFPELSLFVIKLLCARSHAEQASVRRSVLWEFQFGQNYAWMLTIFAVTMTYSIPCPLIVPFGLLYLVLKYAVDRYNIYFAYAPSKINKNIHTSAINFVLIAVVLLQCNILFFTVIRTDPIQGISGFSAITLFIIMLMFIGRLSFGWFKQFTPVYYRTLDGESGTGRISTTSDQPFIPSVLRDDRKQPPSSPDALNPNSHNDNQAAATTLGNSYGATENSHTTRHRDTGDIFAPE